MNLIRDFVTVYRHGRPESTVLVLRAGFGCRGQLDQPARSGSIQRNQRFVKWPLVDRCKIE
jgi:hypothetical protein